ncbi:NAD-dependent epimerase/dehydratase family protein [Agrobacterium sp. ICMP 6402]|uniref:SDR family oxidoreductase n=1 Tax=Agrobacterium sp. ICMP 6402 TaxID=2292443 RepID=UPI001297A508|nr:SDR family oxidoreductase [Agrobacterium sp. ICMP 6402]MQB10768.1 NAD-dependent epimerase/dehydratase family protein [Agrobacterium sp. ICMP 6402]
MKILILGATGFIGSEVMRSLHGRGHAVTGLARSVVRAMDKWPFANWISADLARMMHAPDWEALVSDHDAIVNCAGALQDGLSDDLAATQEKAMLALYDAATQAGGRLMIQISARTAGAASDLPFLTTKRRADAALAASVLPFVFLRPALVVGRNAHGGTALVRALASFPLMLPLVNGTMPVQTVAVEDVAAAVCAAIDGEIPPSSDLELAAGETLTLQDVVAMHRQWLGLRPAPTINLPAAFMRPVSLMADAAGALGWRSPLRSTAMTVMSEGIVTEGEVRPVATSLRTLRQTLAAHPSGVQDLRFARLYLLKPLVILCLSLFWLLSGLVPLLNINAAAAHFLPFMPQAPAVTLTLATCLIDIALGVTVLLRPLARKALIGMLLVSAAYLAGGSLLEPDLWLDPLGPLVKVLPSVALTLVALATLDER